jgi:hypothetical protein
MPIILKPRRSCALVASPAAHTVAAGATDLQKSHSAVRVFLDQISDEAFHIGALPDCGTMPSGTTAAPQSDNLWQLGSGGHNVRSAPLGRQCFEQAAAALDRLIYTEALLDFPDARGDRLHDRHAELSLQPTLTRGAGARNEGARVGRCYG